MCLPDSIRDAPQGRDDEEHGGLIRTWSPVKHDEDSGAVEDGSQSEHRNPSDEPDEGREGDRTNGVTNSKTNYNVSNHMNSETTGNVSLKLLEDTHCYPRIFFIKLSGSSM